MNNKEELEKKIDDQLSQYLMAKHCISWLKTQCPKCNTYNWLTNDDDYCDFDNSKLDSTINICQCYNCQLQFWTDQTVKIILKSNLLINQILQFDLQEEIIIIKGQQKPT